MPRWLRSWTTAATDLVFPPACAFCNEPSPPLEDGTLLCKLCVSHLAHRQQSLCPRCGLPAPAATPSEGACPDCRAIKHSFCAVRSLGFYENHVREAVLKIKHHSWEHLAMALGRRLGAVAADSPFPEPPDLVVPIPMHWLQRLYRGTSAAETLARALASASDWPFAGDLLRCLKMTKTQSQLTAPERRKNVKGAYAASRSYDISGARILLVDDVITTGATCDSAAKVLVESGATTVYAISVARGTGMRS